MPHSLPGAQLATRLVFLVSGFGLACWAPLVPFAKARLGIGDGALGVLLLCLGLGSVISMQIAGGLVARHGARGSIFVGGAGMAVTLPLLTLAPGIATLGATLLLFGAFLGAIEVGMNVHAVEVETREGRPLMSGFHGLFSVGGFAGSALMTLALSAGVGAAVGTVVASALMAACLIYAWPRLIGTMRADRPPLFAVPRGIVILLAGLAAITFLSEGAILDWSAVLLTGGGLMTEAHGGVGYMIFAVAMTVGRLGGDTVVARLGDRRTMAWGGVLAVLGFAILLTAPVAAVAVLGFLTIGLGASNTVPILFRQTGVQRTMPAGLAVAAISTVGYAGILAGPACIGFIAQSIGLHGAVWLLTGLLCLVPLSARLATGPAGREQPLPLP